MTEKQITKSFSRQSFLAAIGARLDLSRRDRSLCPAHQEMI